MPDLKKFHVCNSLLQVTLSDTHFHHLPSRVPILIPLAVGALEWENLKC